MLFSYRRLIPFFFAAACVLFIPHSVSAATLFMTADKAGGLIGDTVTVSLSLDSEGVSVNAIQGDLNFDPDSVEPVGVQSNDSMLTFWLQEPSFDVGAGKLSFIGGSTSGQTGRSLQVLHATFRIKRAGRLPFNVTNAAVTAADGSGTNVLSSIRNLEINGFAPNDTVNLVSVPTIVPPPVQIKRKAVPSRVLPITPDISVMLYPDATRWYNVRSNFLVGWTLPPDVTAIATTIDQIPTTNPSKSEGLFDNKYFGLAPEGVSYLHIRFKNNIGWGPTTHHRIAVDTVPPVSFPITFREGDATDTPNPTVELNGGDQLSGLSRYLIQVDTGSVDQTTGTSFMLPMLLPGKHAVNVSSLDFAGNKTESMAEVMINPIESPVIGSVSSVVYVGEGGVQIQGSSVPNATISLHLKTVKGEFKSLTTTEADGNGRWSSIIDYPLLKGSYIVEAVARDTRGARSFPTTSPLIRVTERPFLTIFGFDLSYMSLFVIVLTLLTGMLIYEVLTREQNWKRVSANGATVGKTRAKI